jgi:hypothetical protein
MTGGGGKVLLAAALVGLAGGCRPGARGDLEHELQLARQQSARLNTELQALQQTAAAQEQQIRTLQHLGDKRLDLLFHVVNLEVGRYSTGINADDLPGDDFIRVYLIPRDAAGDPIKAAGTVTVQLFDLAAPAEANLLGTYQFPLEQVAKSWVGGFMTYHYRFDCPWKSGPPAHPDVTVRASFTDYLTGKEFTAQRLIKVALASSTQPAKQPATSAGGP